ncbi:hypothetical protein J6590_032471 [Homalodisca vitripennis]|nr:hypothetical protein J6590_032471 [Homalodisca vitripennis]
MSSYELRGCHPKHIVHDAGSMLIISALVVDDNVPPHWARLHDTSHNSNSVTPRSHYCVTVIKSSCTRIHGLIQRSVGRHLTAVAYGYGFLRDFHITYGKVNGIKLEEM